MKNCSLMTLKLVLVWVFPTQETIASTVEIQAETMEGRCQLSIPAEDLIEDSIKIEQDRVRTFVV
jgi:hypothetical protein